ncbi:AAA domain-containing protein [Thaumasiovibrio subtropicus]|uniref:AAA domain-containing protein n=1 Tax=Thaumasiovibrio subtropicus TaxID=1891207 RepID=UPI000B34BF61|nr:AAA domain-containing protein [Thaumasiovibrio subtropicus]
MYQSCLDYLRRCYREDCSELSLSNVSRIREDRRYQVTNEELLLTGKLPYLPVPSATVLQSQTDTYRRERRLVYTSLMVKGTLKQSTGLATQRKIEGPLLFCSAHFTRDDTQTLCIELDLQELRVNEALLRQLLKPDKESDCIASFPMITVPVSVATIGLISQWLSEYTVIDDLEQLAYWPRLPDEEASSAPSSRRKSAMRLTCESRIVLAERGRGARGILHEMRQLCDGRALSAPIHALLDKKLHDETRLVSPQNTQTCVTRGEQLPYALSEAQRNALSRAATETLSMISGPPGTGKSFTIAAMAIDRMLQGESVLIVTKTEQAIDVIGSKLRRDFDLHNGFVHASATGMNKTLRAYLKDLLFHGMGESGSVDDAFQSLTKGYQGLQQRARRFEKSLWAARFVSKESAGRWHQRWRARWYRYLKGEQHLWQAQHQLNEATKAYQTSARRYINRKRGQQLHAVLSSHRAVLSQFADALKARHSKSQEERLAATDFQVLLSALPIWLATSDELSEGLPLQKGLFDLVIFDEATQSDITSAMPALYRAKRAVVVGDSKQLRHVSFLSRRKQQHFWQHCGLPASLYDGCDYRENALLDWVSSAITSQQSVTFLDEHYRSRASLIEFSNLAFYGSQLKIMQARPHPEKVNGLQFHFIKEGKRTQRGQNSAECEAIVRAISAHVDKYSDAPYQPTLGVVSPFRDQAEYLQRVLHKQFSPAVMDGFEIRVATPYGFQGEERDVMLISMAIDSDSGRAAAYLNREDMFNVMITRAKEQQHVYHSLPAEALPNNNLFRRYLDSHASHQDIAAVQEASEQVCAFTRAVQSELNTLNIPNWVGFNIAGQTVDIVCQYQEKVLGIDLIGYDGEFESHFDIESYRALERAGIDLLLVPYRLWQTDRRVILDRVAEILDI